MTVYPTQIERIPDGRLRVVWSDGSPMTYSIRTLRDNCPCATCREKHSVPPAPAAELLRVLSPAEVRPLDISSMRPVGNYAYSIQYSDEHDSGIYTFELLRKLGTIE